ncbi:MAG: replication protein [bacterium]|nr:replication protein [bacterium]
MFENNIDSNHQPSTKNLPKKPKFKLQGATANSEYFVRYPQKVYDMILMSNLPVQAKEILDVVARFTYGFGIKSSYFPWVSIQPFVSGHKSKVNRIIKGLINARILIGGPIQSKYNKNIGGWELAINGNTDEWDVSRDNDKLDNHRKLQKISAGLKAMNKSHVKQYPQNDIPKQPEFEISDCEFAAAPDEQMTQNSETWCIT